MGAWGYFEHENDKFSDFVKDDTSLENLLEKMKIANATYLVGIFNVITPKTQFPKKYLKKCIKYLDYEIEHINEDKLKWSNLEDRLAALKKQLSNMKRYETRIS